MIGYVVRRVLLAVPLVLGIATIVFLVVHLAPGDPTTRLVPPTATQDVIDQIRRNFGLDQPLHVQYLLWLKGVVTGDLGVSFSQSIPVGTLLATTIPNTVLLSGCALALAFAVGIVVGAVQAVRQYSVLDSGLSVVLLFFYSMPGFWLGLMLMLGLSLYARTVWDLPIWFPAGGVASTDADLLPTLPRLLDRLWHLVLPTISLSLALTAGIARYMRGSMLEVIRQDYVRTARAKGLPERAVIFRHALRNALGPIITLVGLYVPVLLSGTVLIESVFAWPGMGRLIFDSVISRDYPVVMAGTLFFAIAVVVANLLADVLYAVADPRVRYE